jgi:chemotaxis protein methyltransferase CheR
MMGDLPGPPLSAEEQRLLRDVIREHSGIDFRDDARYLLQRRLRPRLEALGLPSYAAYHRYLATDPDRGAELERLVELVTTHETYFFREPASLEAFQGEILPELHATKKASRRLTVWSAGCSTGEEAYTIAILIVESGRFAGWDVRVFGNDISRRVLAVARAATYGRASFRATDERLRARYFHEVDGKHVVSSEIRALVSFGHGNLLDENMLAIVGEVDVIFCRNVLMYFDVATRRRVVAALYKRLARGGTLILGHSESLLNLTTAFELVHLPTDMVYRKP